MNTEDMTETLILKPSSEEVFSGSLGEVVWNDENGSPINNPAEYFKEKEKNDLQEAMKKYIPLGSVVCLQNRIGLYVIIGYKYDQDGTVFDYLAVRHPSGMTGNSPTYFFNHSEITKFHHIGMNDPLYKTYKEQLLEEDNGKQNHKTLL